jgi:hypothetical protein
MRHQRGRIGLRVPRGKLWFAGRALACSPRLQKDSCGCELWPLLSPATRPLGRAGRDMRTPGCVFRSVSLRDGQTPMTTLWPRDSINCFDFTLFPRSGGFSPFGSRLSSEGLGRCRLARPLPSWMPGTGAVRCQRAAASRAALSVQVWRATRPLTAVFKRWSAAFRSRLHGKVPRVAVLLELRDDMIRDGVPLVFGHSLPEAAYHLPSAAA